jgi:hypothetical protein
VNSCLGPNVGVALAACTRPPADLAVHEPEAFNAIAAQAKAAAAA